MRALISGMMVGAVEMAMREVDSPRGMERDGSPAAADAARDRAAEKRARKNVRRAMSPSTTEAPDTQGGGR